METHGYGQFCPLAMAAEVLCSRWTMVLLREFIAGSTRFNDLRRGVPRMSPTLLSKRLKELENAEIIERIPSKDGTNHEYRLTEAGEDVRDVIIAMGKWGQRWAQANVSLRNLDPSLLMWDMRRNIQSHLFPTGRKWVLHVMYPELATGKRNWWLLIENGAADLCLTDPGLDVDLYIVTDLRTMTSIWMGLVPITEEMQSGRVKVTGDERLKRATPDWLGLSPFAGEPKRRMAA